MPGILAGIRVSMVFLDENATGDFGRNPCVFVVFHETVAGIRVSMVFFDEVVAGDFGRNP